VILPIAVLAILGAVAAPREARPSDPARNGCTTSPSAPAALIAQDRSPVSSGTAGLEVDASPQARPSIPEAVDPATNALLIDVHVFEKYRSFHEALSAP
jgi:hypothetical protein